MTEILLVADERKKNTRCTATCIYPGCSNLIRYDADDYERNLYCDVHVTVDGRHSQTKILNPKPVAKPEKKVVFRCPKDKSRETTSYQDFVDGIVPDCIICGGKMIFHKEV